MPVVGLPLRAKVMPVLWFFLIVGVGLGAIQSAAAMPAMPQAGAWTQQDPLPTRYTFDQVDMLSATEGWAVAYQDILQTTDGGITWARQPSPIADHLYSVRFLDAQHG